MNNVVDFCSLCFSYNNNIQNAVSLDSDGKVIQEKLTDFFPETINIDAEILLHICGDCLENINNTIKFKQKCLDNISILHEYVQKLKADNCTKSLQLSDILNYKLDRSKSDKNVEEVPIKDELNEEFIIKDENIQENFVDCNVVIKTEPENNSCELIQEEIPRKADTESSSTATENTQKKSKSGKQHTQICHICNKSFAFKSSLERHIFIHTDDRPIECPVCQKKFYLANHLKKHSYIHTGERPYACDLCDKKFISSSNLKTHHRVHVNERPYKCTVCEKSFIQSGSLKKHLRIHSGDRPFECHLCESKFTQKENLNQHIRTHYGVKPYNCEYCGQAFAQLTSLNRHEKRHKEKNDKKMHGAKKAKTK